MKIAYETICNAVKGNPDAMVEILAVYQPYINTIAANRRRPRLQVHLNKQPKSEEATRLDGFF